MCRRPAAELHAKKAELDAAGIRLVGIVKEDIGTELADFQKACWPEAEIFIDESKDMYRVAAPLVKLGKCSLLALLCNKRRRKASGDAGKQYGQNFVGEGFILGSLIVVDPTGKVTFAHAEKSFDDHPDFGGVVTAAVEAAKGSV
mmetsp:Transcript_123023/g.213443  ORF Transcript_123023/g.213443 Transcript_123023/m.213443 type:complete len:145 (+) Transcript_123023:253-687(+)